MFEVLIRVSVVADDPQDEFYVFEKLISMPAPPAPGMEIYMFSRRCGMSIPVGNWSTSRMSDRFIWDATASRYIVEHVPPGGDSKHKSENLLSVGFKEVDT